MKLKFPLAILALLLASLACNTILKPAPEPTVAVRPTQPQKQNSSIPQTEADVPRIPVEEAKAALDSGQAILIDVRSAEFYLESHAAGAISIPLENFEGNIMSVQFPKDQWIITYCT